MNVTGVRLRRRLVRLGYDELSSGYPGPGEYRGGAGVLDIGIRAFRDLSGENPAQFVRLRLDGPVIREIVRAEDGRPLRLARLEPELLGSYEGGVLGERREVKLTSLPEHVPAAILAVEDARFSMHFGIDPIGLARAVVANLRGGRIVQGGSTITQQLAKNFFLSPERDLRRKANEAVLALILEARLSKQEILELYLNHVYLGRSGSIGIYGVSQAARAFFGKPPQELTLAEAATLAGLIHSPNRTSPIRHPERAKVRRNVVLDLMNRYGWISAAEHTTARATPVEVRSGVKTPRVAPFFVDEVLRRVRRMGHDVEIVRGLSVYTTLDLEAQGTAERALTSHLDALGNRHRHLAKADPPLEGSVVLLEASSGFVRAMAGGRDFSRSQFNRVTRSARQPGSAFKPFVYLAALESPDTEITAGTLISDEPLRLQVGNKLWEPKNYDKRFLGEVTVRRALEGSRNVPTVEVALRTGLERVAKLARMAGIRDLQVVPSMALGSAEVSLLDLVAAYTVFPNLGKVVRPALIRAVLSHDGRVLYRDEIRRWRVATAPAAYVTSYLLEGVVERGTGRGVRRLGLTAPVAGKTGTSNEGRDAWFVGYSPDWIAGVWVGFDGGAPTGLTGASGALPIWTSLMKDVLAARAKKSFPVPTGIVFRDVDRASGLIATRRCPDSVREAFVVGTVPTEDCDGYEAGRRGGRANRTPAGTSSPSLRDQVRRPLDALGNLFRELFGGN
jgi:penicillin-binding protein 1B